MTSVEKILIQGIRSFDYKEGSVIDFYKPLTLIVGVNGAGKTTIIECLKYASTGEMPPNCSNGQAFIHDPKIAGEAEVKAQIKMRFKTPNGKPIVATRSMSLIQKPNNKQEFRQIDSSLQSYDKDGQKKSKSFRCSDLDKEIPELMGASKSVLKNVIFCHQEESTWPLSESAKLKVKFDEIFSAVRYTKALKSIKDKRKELATQIKELKLKLEVVNTNKEHSHRIKKEINNMENQITNLKDSIIRMNEQLKEKKEIVNRIALAMENVKSSVAEVQMLQGRKTEMDKTKTQLFNSLPDVFDEPDEELIFMVKQFDEEVGRMQKAHEDLSDNQITLNNEREVIVAEKNAKTMELGRIMAQMTAKVESETELQKHIDDLVNRYKIDRDQDASNQDIINILTTKYTEIGLAIDNAQKEGQEKIAKLQEELNGDSGERQKLSERRHQFSTQIDTNNRKLEQLAAEKKRVVQAGNEIDQLVNSAEQLGQEILALEQQLAQSSHEEGINQKRQEKKEVDEMIDEMNNDIRKTSALASILTRVTQKKKDLAAKQKLVSSRMQENNDSFKKALEDDIDQYNINELLTQLKSLGSTLQQDRKERQEAFDDLVEQLNQTENELKMYRQEFDKKEKQFNLIEPKLSILDQSQLLNLQDSINQLNHQLHKLERNYAILESEDVLYKEYVDKAHDESECGLCSRELKDGELDEFVEKLKNHTHDIPNKLKDIKKEMGEVRSKHSQLEELKPQYDIYIRLKSSDLPETKKRILDLETSVESLTPTRTILSKELASLQSRLQLIEKMCYVCESVGQLNKEAQELEKDIQQEEQGLQGYNSSVSLEDKMMQYDQLKKQASLITKSIETIANQSKSLQDSIISKKQQLITTKEKITAQKGSAEVLERINHSEIELQDLNQSLSKNIAETKEIIRKLNESIEKKTKELQEFREMIEKKNRGVMQERNVFGNKLQACKSAMNQGGDINELQMILQGCREESERIDNKLLAIDMDRTKGSQHLDALKNQLSESDMAKRAIRDNLQYRQLKLNTETMEVQINKKRAAITAMISAEDAATHKTLTAEMTVLKSKVDQSSGSVEALEQQKRNSSAELTKSSYKDVEETYRDLFVSIETLELVYKDLDKYYKALDKALMKYHVLKMDEINKTIRELWTSTYKGNDIDTIEIRSEESTAANKTINYRVVMIKGEVELDMRGRCSAGQKVLACLIIRLALAENFCANCGILALDEPTSHLDRANIESFATALLNIIEARKAQRGFQLIIITHDEEFVQYLSRGNFTDYYWRVTKDANQHSNIEKKEISKM